MTCDEVSFFNLVRAHSMSVYGWRLSDELGRNEKLRFRKLTFYQYSPSDHITRQVLVWDDQFDEVVAKRELSDEVKRKVDEALENN